MLWMSASLTKNKKQTQNRTRSCSKQNGEWRENSKSHLMMKMKNKWRRTPNQWKKKRLRSKSNQVRMFRSNNKNKFNKRERRNKKFKEKKAKMMSPLSMNSNWQLSQVSECIHPYPSKDYQLLSSKDSKVGEINCILFSISILHRIINISYQLSKPQTTLLPLLSLHTIRRTSVKMDAIT